jgi:hypothetical protein
MGSPKASSGAADLSRFRRPVRALYQRHKDGSIWQSTGQPCTSGTSCPGWTELDGNPGTVAIAAGLLTVYQLHKDGSVWRSTGVACTSATACPGWTELDDNSGPCRSASPTAA